MQPSKGLWNQLDKTYKYQPNTESLGIIFSALSQYASKIPYNVSLTNRLNLVREQIKYDQTWRTPTLDECKEGLPIEIMTSWGWQPGTYPSIFRQDTHIGLFYGDRPYDEQFKYATLRTKI